MELVPSDVRLWGVADDVPPAVKRLWGELAKVEVEILAREAESDKWLARKNYLQAWVAFMATEAWRAKQRDLRAKLLRAA
jgi:hypothetical protein